MESLNHDTLSLIYHLLDEYSNKLNFILSNKEIYKTLQYYFTKDKIQASILNEYYNRIKEKEENNDYDSDSDSDYDSDYDYDYGCKEVEIVLGEIIL